MEGNPLMEDNLEEILKEADSAVVLAMQDGVIGCYYSSSLDDLEVLDILSFSTNEMYNKLDITKH